MDAGGTRSEAVRDEGPPRRRGWWLAYLAVAVLFLGAVAATTALRGDDGAATGTGNGREVAARGPARPSDAGATTVPPPGPEPPVRGAWR